MTKLFTFLFSFLTIFTTIAFSQNNSNNNLEKNSSEKQNLQITQKVNKILPFSKGVNLSSWLEAFGIGNAASTYFSKNDFIDMKNLGVEVVRIPIHFEPFSSGKPDFVVQDWLWKYVDDAISWCEELKMYVIIDFHNYTASDTKTSQNIEKTLLKIWAQIAARYKDKSDFVIYEIMNEPHIKNSDGSANISKWNSIQGKVLKLIRTIDTNHFVIVGGGDFNSIQSLLTIPDYNDEKLIYNFHDYSPFLFTHQGADWTNIKELKNIPFPYSKEKMPPLPKNATNEGRWHYSNYKNLSSQKELLKPIEQAINFANKRNVPLMCNEFGVYQKYADKTERLNWYKTKVLQFDQSNICRISWDYFGGFGIFNSEAVSIFPDDLNEELINILGYKKPSYKNSTWEENAKNKNDYTIYKNGFANGIVAFGYSNGNSPKSDICKKDFIFENEKNKNENENETSENTNLENEKNPDSKKIADSESYIHLVDLQNWNFFAIDFKSSCDFSNLAKEDKSIEFEIRTKDPFEKISVYFVNSKSSKYEWRMTKYLTQNDFMPDNKWHKISFNFSQMRDIGAWDNDAQTWINGQNAFDWKDVRYLRFDVEDSKFKEGLDIKNIIIK